MQEITVNANEQVENDQAIKQRLKEDWGIEIPENSPVFYATIEIEEVK